MPALKLKLKLLLNYKIIPIDDRNEKTEQKRVRFLYAPLEYKLNGALVDLARTVL